MATEEIGVSSAIEIRAATTFVRLAAMAAIAVLVGVVGHWPLAAPWFVAYATAQLAFKFVAARQAKWGPVPAYVLSFVGFTIAGAPCWHLWAHVGVLGAAASSLFLSGMLAQLVASSLGARTLFLSSAAPLFGYMIAVPVFYFGLAAPGELVAGVACPLLLLGYLTVVWRSQHRFLRLLEQNRRAAEAGMRAKTEFLALMSHEIRTPLNAVVGCAQLLQRTGLDGEQKRLADALCHGGELVTHIINDVLELSKIEAGRLEMDPAACHLGDLVRDTAEFWRARVEDGGLQLRVEVAAAADQVVLLDRIRVQQILSNLISNAAKFTEQGSVTLSARAAPAGAERLDIEISVVDTGIGMSHDLVGRLFTKFEQGDKSISRRFGGTGLGLAISQELAALHGGAITVQSAPGAGSAFHLRLRATIAEPEPVEAPEEPVEARDLSALRILVADDNAVNRMLVEHFVAPLGAEVAAAESGAEAVELCARHAFDVILMDVQMPGMTGLEAARLIRAGGGPNAAAPIIALTADTDEAQRQACRAAGMTGHVAKPIDARALLTSIAAATTQAAAAA